MAANKRAKVRAHLRDFQFMPVDVKRLMDSDLWIEAAEKPRLGHAAMSLWCASWHQTPPGTLPVSDHVLFRLSMCPSRAEWDDVKERILADWETVDGRYRHPVVYEKVTNSLAKKRKFLARTAKARAEKARRNRSQIQEDTSVTSSVTSTVTDSVTSSVTSHKGEGKGNGEGKGKGENTLPIGSVLPLHPVVAPDEPNDEHLAWAPPTRDQFRAICSETWERFQRAYFERYGTEHARNAKTNTQVVQFVKHLGAESPDVASWYVSHPGRRYVEASHAFGLLLAHYAGLRTEWARQSAMTETKARAQDRVSSQPDILKNLEERWKKS